MLAVVVGVGLWLTMKSRANNKAADAVMTVRTEAAARGDLVEMVSAPGQVQPKTKVQISARVAARILELPFDEGMAVKKGNAAEKGSLLVKLDATEMEAQLRATEARANAQRAQLEEAQSRILASDAEIAAAKVMLEDAKRDLGRQKQLLTSKDVSQSLVDQAQAKVDQQEKQLEASQRQLEASKKNLVVLKHQIDAAEAEIARAKDNLSYTAIYSPIDGIVTRMNAKMGEMVVMGTMNNAGTVILEVSDLSEMQVDAQIDESNIAAVKEGQKAKVRISAYPDEVFDGVVKNVGLDTAEQQQRMMGGGGGNQGKWYKAKVVLQTKGRRVPAGLSADVDIETNVHRGVLKVPTQAVMGRNIDELPEAVKGKAEVDKSKTLATVVYVYRDGKAETVPVTIGPGDMTHTVIAAGLKEGERVIVGPYKVLPTLADGAKCKEEGATTQPTTRTATQGAVAAGNSK
ncbi:MAG TPA: efflux RND transporter periplasmic adaptor subunit [Tepidisphaeraceae bacterium]